MKPLLTLALGAGLACTALPGLAAVDLILHNAKVYTAAPGQPLQQAVAVDGEKIVAVGSDQAVLRLKTAGTQVIDLGGKVLMPGMLDSHSHAIKGGLQLELANLAGKKLREYVDRNEFFDWLDLHHEQVEFIFHLGARTDTAEQDPAVFDLLNFTAPRYKIEVRFTNTYNNNQNTAMINATVSLYRVFKNCGMV